MLPAMVLAIVGRPTTAVQAAIARRVAQVAQAAREQLPQHTGPLAADAATRRQPDGSYRLPPNPYMDPHRG